MPLLYTVFQENFNIHKQQYNINKENVYFTDTFGLRRNYYGIKHGLCQCSPSNQQKYCKMMTNSVPQPENFNESPLITNCQTHNKSDNLQTFRNLKMQPKNVCPRLNIR